MVENYYELLGVPEDADAETIRRAYRRLVALHHPDVRPNDPESEELVRRLNTARDLLTDRAQRERYDVCAHPRHRRGYFEEWPVPSEHAR